MCGRILGRPAPPPHACCCYTFLHLPSVAGWALRMRNLRRQHTAVTRVAACDWNCSHKYRSTSYYLHNSVRGTKLSSTPLHLKLFVILNTFFYYASRSYVITKPNIFIDLVATVLIKEKTNKLNGRATDRF